MVIFVKKCQLSGVKNKCEAIAWFMQLQPLYEYLSMDYKMCLRLFSSFYSHTKNTCPWNWSTALQMQFYIKLLQNSCPSDIMAYLFTNIYIVKLHEICSLFSNWCYFVWISHFQSMPKMSIFTKITNFLHQKELQTCRMIYAALASVWTPIQGL